MNRMNHKIYIILFLTFINLLCSQDLKQFKNIQELNNEELKIYKIIKDVVNESHKTEGVSFFDIYSVKEDEHFFYFETYIYGKPEFQNCRKQYLSATYLISFSLEKVKIIDTSKGEWVTNSRRTSSEDITYSLDILDGRKNNNSFRENYIKRLLSKTPILNSKYKRAIYDESLTRNKIDESLYKNVKQVSYVDQKIAISYENNNYGIRNNKEEILLPFEYQDIKLTKSGILVSKENKYYFLDHITFKKISDDYEKVNFTLDCYDFFGEDVMIVKKNGKFTILNMELKPLLPNFYKEIKVVHKLILAKNEDGKLVLIKPNPLRETNIVYDDINNIDDNFIIVKNDNKYGIIDQNGNKIVSIEYDKLEYDHNSKSFIGSKNQKEFLFPLNNLTSLKK